MKKFEVELHLFPQSYEVEAETKEEAIQKAKELFWEKNEGKSVYSVERVEEVELCEKCHEREITRNGYCSLCHREVFGV